MRDPTNEVFPFSVLKGAMNDYLQALLIQHCLVGECVRRYLLSEEAPECNGKSGNILSILFLINLRLFRYQIQIASLEEKRTKGLFEIHHKSRNTKTNILTLLGLTQTLREEERKFSGEKIQHFLLFPDQSQTIKKTQISKYQYRCYVVFCSLWFSCDLTQFLSPCNRFI